MTTTDTIYDILLTALSTDGAIKISGGTVGGATEATLIQVRDNLADIEAYVNELESLTNSLITLNTQIAGSTDGLEALLTSMNGSVDGVEGLITSTNNSLSAIETALAAIEGFVDGLEAISTDGSQKTQIVDSATGVQVLSSAPGSDTGQRAIAVRVVSQLGVSETADGAIQDGVDPLIKATVTASNALKVDGSAVTQPVSAAQSGTWNITNVSGTVSLPTGAATSAKQDTGNTSLGSIDGKLNSLGQKAATGSVPVVLASDQPSINVAPGQVAATGSALTAVSASTATTTIISANSARRALFLFNDSSSSVAVALSTTVTSTLFTHKMGPYGYWEIPSDPCWRGDVSGLWDVANGALRVTELT